MPASILGEIVAGILEPIFAIGGYFVGRAVVPVVSLGRIKCDDFAAKTRRRSLRESLRWSSLYHRRGSQLYLTAEGTATVGVLIVLAMAAAALILYTAERASTAWPPIPRR